LSEVENNFQSFVYNWVRTISPRLVNDFSFSLIDSENRRDSPLANAQDRPEFTRPLIQEGPPAHEIPFGVDQHRVQFRNNVSLLAGAHNIKFGGEFQIVNDSAFDRSFRSGVVSLTESFPTQDRNRDGKIDDNDTPVFLSLRVRAANNGNIPDIDNKYLGLYFQDSWQVTKRFTLSLGVRYELDNNINNRRDQAQVDPAIAAAFPQEPRRDKNNFAPRVGFNWDVLGDGSTVVRGGYGISYSRVLLQSGLVDRTSGLNINELRLGSILDEAGNFLPNDPTPSNPFTGILIASFASNLAVSDPRLVNPYTQQFTFGVQREIVRDLVLSVDGLHTLGLKFIGRKNISVDPIIFAAVSSLKNNYDALLVKLEKRANRFNFIAAYTLSKASSQTQDDQGPPFADMVSDVTRKAPPANDVRNRFSFAGVVGLPLGLRFSSILTLESDPPFDILLSDFSRLPFVQINAGGRQFRNGRELNAFISQLNNAGGANGAPIPLVRDDLKFGDSFASMDLRVTKNFKITERLSLEAIAEGFNIFNVTNVRGSQLSGGAGGGFSGFQNVLVRDSEDPRDPGFLRSSTFGNKLQTAGGVFGTGGPRSFQFAIKLAF
jgi:hypothetical protein